MWIVISLLLAPLWTIVSILLAPFLTSASRIRTNTSNAAKISEDDDALDLRDIALLLNYERASTEPRFRYTKLREVATPGFNFKTVLCKEPEWIQNRVPKTGFVFDRKSPGWFKEEPDTPYNLLSTPVPPPLRRITPQALETYFWQARNHDGCYAAVLAFQHFIGLFPVGSTELRVRTVHRTEGAKEYTTLASTRMIMEMMLSGSKAITLSIVSNEGIYITDQDPSSPHAVLGFSSSLFGNVDTILDMASLQFGDVGRGDNGSGLFVLEPIAQYKSRVAKYARSNTFAAAKQSYRMRDNAPNNAWLKEVARRAKDRWDNRDTTPWCGHCGAPPRGGNSLQRCPTCKAVHYCNTEHRKAAWSYHKHFCNAF